MAALQQVLFLWSTPGDLSTATMAICYPLTFEDITAAATFSTRLVTSGPLNWKASPLNGLVGAHLRSQPHGKSASHGRGARAVAFSA